MNDFELITRCELIVYDSQIQIDKLMKVCEADTSSCVTGQISYSLVKASPD